MSNPILALIQLLADSASELRMGSHSYIVGGAPRDFLLGHDIKDIDAVVEPKDGYDALKLAMKVAGVLGVNCHPDHFGVVHIGPVMDHVEYCGADLIGQKVEIVGSRKEKYDRSRGRDSHKPASVAVGTIHDDVYRRDFTINTLLWRLGDLRNGPENAPVVDETRLGIKDLKDGVIRTPLDPQETFDDDPSRMLRAVRFAAKYGFEIMPRTVEAIQKQSQQLLRLPYEAIDPLFFDKILTLPFEKVVEAFRLMKLLDLLVPVTTLIPASRMRRAIQEKVSDPRMLIFLASHKLSVGLKFTERQLESLQGFADSFDDAALGSLWQRFLKPLDTERFIASTGASGPAIGLAVDKAKDLVLNGLPPEAVQAQVESAYFTKSL